MSITHNEADEIVQSEVSWIPHLDPYPTLVEMEDLLKRFVRYKDSSSSSGTEDSNETAETVFTLGDKDSDDANGGNNGDLEDIDNSEPNNNSRCTNNRNIRRSMRDFYFDDDTYNEELESEDSDLFNPKRKCNDDTVDRLKSIREQGRTGEEDSVSWHPTEPLMSSSTLAGNMTSSSIRTPESVSTCNMTSSLRSLEPLLTSSWRGSQLHLLRTICDIDTSLEEEIFQDCVEMIEKQLKEDKTFTEMDKASKGASYSEDVVYLSDLSSCSSFGSCYDDTQGITFSPDQAHSFGTCFDDSDALKFIQDPDLENILEGDMENTTNNNLKRTLATDQYSRFRKSSNGSFEFIENVETCESLYMSCKSDLIWVEESDSNLKKFGDVKDSLIETLEGTRKRLSSSLDNLELTKKRLSSTFKNFLNWKNSGAEHQQELDTSARVESKFKVKAEVKVERDNKIIEDVDDDIENISLDSDLLLKDFKKEDSFEVIHDSECAWSCKTRSMSSRYQPLVATSDSMDYDHHNCSQGSEQAFSVKTIHLSYNFMKEEFKNYESADNDIFRRKCIMDEDSTKNFDRIVSQEGLLSDTESHIDDKLKEDRLGNKIYNM